MSRLILALVLATFTATARADDPAKVLTRIAFGFHTSHALIALAMLSLGRHRPALPGRT